MKEADLKAQVKAYLDEIGAWWFMPVPTGYGRRGIPDFIICHKGKFYAIETKSTGGLLTPFQIITLGQIRAAGGKARHFYDVEAVRRFIQ